MRDKDNIRRIAALDIDYMGFIFYPESKRFAGIPPDAGIVKAVPDSIKKVGVFVNETIPVIKNICETLHLDFIQLHGNESPEFCRKLRDEKIQVIKTFHIDRNFDFSFTGLYRETADYLLFDTKTPEFGGSGKSFDWELLENYAEDIPFFLSGGIAPEHAETLGESATGKMEAVDINSRFETAPGIKDTERIKTFIRTLKSKMRA